LSEVGKVSGFKVEFIVKKLVAGYQKIENFHRRDTEKAQRFAENFVFLRVSQRELRASAVKIYNGQLIG